jgi:hypothetical protein
MPVYEVQLNGYKFIAERLEYPKVEAMHLIYFEPPVLHDGLLDEANDTGFEMGFSAKVVKIDKKVDIPSLLAKAKKVYSNEMPEGIDNCKNCGALGDISEALQTDK